MTDPARTDGAAHRERCLVVGPSWVGDMVMAQSLFRLLAERHPEMRIDVLAPAWSRDVVGRMPEVHSVIAAPFAHGRLDWRARRRLAAELRAGAYARCIVLPNSWKSALVPFLAGIPRRTGYVGELRYGLLNDVRRLDKAALPRLVDRYCALALPPGAARPPVAPPRLRVDAAARARLLDALGLASDPPVLALCPGAEYGPAKRWPEDAYAALARQHRAAGGQVWLFGSARDREVTARVNAASGDVCQDLAGRTTLGEAVDLLSCAAAAVSNDSGLMHLAAAVGVPLVAVYGSTDAGYTPPLSARARVLSIDLPCRPCFQRRCPLGHTDCLHRIEPQRVLDTLATLRDG